MILKINIRIQSKWISKTNVMMTSTDLILKLNQLKKELNKLTKN